MKLVGQKYLQYTNQFRQMHHTLQLQKIKSIMKTQRSSVHFQKTFPKYPIQYTWNYKNMPLHVYNWQPTNKKPKALIINLNALNSHTGLSGRMAQIMAEAGFIMTGVDYPNFGKSHSPNPGHIQSVKQLVQITEGFLIYTKQKYPDLPIFLNGLSMGGTIAFQLGLKKSKLVNGCILLNPAFRDNPVNNGFLKKVIMFIGKKFPKFQTMKPIRSHSSKYSLHKYKVMDPLMYSGKVWTSTTWAVLSNMRNISKRQKFQQFNLPFLCIQGGSDKILDPFTVFQLQKNCKSLDKQIVIVPDLWHALWFDDHHDQIVQMIKIWIQDRIQNKKPVRIQEKLQIDQNIKNANKQIGRHTRQHHSQKAISSSQYSKQQNI